MVSIRDVSSQQLINKTAEELKKQIEMPQWAVFVKTGTSKQRVPEQKDWWYFRSASILRRIYIDGPVGVSRLRSYYGGRKRYGHAPAHFAKGGGKVIRVILQDLEKAGYIKKVDKPKRGRVITPEGIKFLNKAAKQVGKV